MQKVGIPEDKQRDLFDFVPHAFPTFFSSFCGTKKTCGEMNRPANQWNMGQMERRRDIKRCVDTSKNCLYL